MFEAKKKYHYPHDPVKNKTAIVQDIVSARDDSTTSLYRRYKVSPSPEGRYLTLKNGKFCYSEKDITTLFDRFQVSSDTMCGYKMKSK